MRTDAVPRTLDTRGPALLVKNEWQRVFVGEARTALERKLAEYLPERRWFGSKARTIAVVRLVEEFRLPGGSIVLTLIRVRYEDRARETYLLPLTFVSGTRAAELERDQPEAVVTRLSLTIAGRVSPGIVYDAVFDPSFGPSLMEIISRRRRLAGSQGVARGSTTREFPRPWPGGGASDCRLLGREQSNTSILVGDRLILKLTRKVESGVNPELEIGRFFSRKSSRINVPPLAGALEYQRAGREPATLAILQGYVANQGDAWSYTLHWLRHFFEGVRAGRDLELPPSSTSVVELSAQEPSKKISEAMGDYLESARLLGRRTAELHRALGVGSRDPSFVPEPLSPAYRRSLHQSLRSLTAQVFWPLRERVSELPPEVGADVAVLLTREGELLRRFREIRERELAGQRIRCHGDFHLGQVLYTGDDFVIIDFEGEPARPLRERRVKHSPLRDVAGMLRSFHYAAYSALAEQSGPGTERVGALRLLEPAARSWWRWSSAAFLRAYLDVASSGDLLPRSRAEISFLLDLLILEKAIYEMGYELNHRPAWLAIPVQAALEALDPGRSQGAMSPGEAGRMEK